MPLTTLLTFTTLKKVLVQLHVGPHFPQFSTGSRIEARARGPALRESETETANRVRHALYYMYLNPDVLSGSKARKINHSGFTYARQPPPPEPLAIAGAAKVRRRRSATVVS